MPPPSIFTLQRRKRAQQERKLHDLVTGNGSMRVVLRSLNSKSQQQLADRMYFIENLGKSSVRAAFKGLGVAHRQQTRKRKQRKNILKRKSDAFCESSSTEDYGIKTLETVSLSDLEIISFISNRE